MKAILFDDIRIGQVILIEDTSSGNIYNLKVVNIDRINRCVSCENFKPKIYPNSDNQFIVRGN